MDLIATVTPAGYGSGQTAKDIVDVWRLNGQRVFGATFESADDHDGTPAAARRHEGGRGSQTNDKDKEKERGFVRALSWRRDGKAFTCFFLSHIYGCFLKQDSCIV